MKALYFLIKHQFDIGMQLLGSAIAIALLSVNASGIILGYFGIKAQGLTWFLLFLAVIFAGIWLFGAVMDRMKYQQHAERVAIRRSEVWQEHMAQTNRIEEKLDRLLGTTPRDKMMEAEGKMWKL